MLNNTNNSPLFYEYYAQWVDVYKKGAIREATMAKYLMTQKWIQKLAPELKVSELTRTAYQQILNDYAKEHERQTTLDFHHQLKGDVRQVAEVHKHGITFRGWQPSPTFKAVFIGPVIAGPGTVLHFAIGVYISSVGRPDPVLFPAAEGNGRKE